MRIELFFMRRLLIKEHPHVVQVRFGTTRGIKPLAASMTCYLYATRIAPCKVTMRCSDTLTQEDVLAEVVLSDEWHIVLFNDNHNTFDHVIDCLMEVCGHDALQAEQCAMIVHFKGKCTVKSGDYEELAPIQKSLSEKI